MNEYRTFVASWYHREFRGAPSIQCIRAVSLEAAKKWLAEHLGYSTEEFKSIAYYEYYYSIKEIYND